MFSHAGPFLEKLMENYFRVENDKLEQIAEACGSTSFMVYCFIAKYANQSGKCWPSIKHISEKLKISVPTVNRAIKSLDDNGFIIREKRSRKNNLYRIPKSEKSADCVRENSPDISPVIHDDISPVIHDDISPVIHYKEKSDKEKSDKEKIQNNKGDIVNVTKLLDRVLSFDEYVREMEANDPDRFTSCAAVLDALRIYFSMYRRIMREEHPRLRVSQWGKHIEDIIEFQTPEGKVSFFECDPEDIFEKYFNTEFNPGNGQRCDYRLPHFCSMANSCNFLYEASMA